MMNQPAKINNVSSADFDVKRGLRAHKLSIQKPSGKVSDRMILEERSRGVAMVPLLKGTFEDEPKIVCVNSFRWQDPNEGDYLELKEVTHTDFGRFSIELPRGLRKLENGVLESPFEAMLRETAEETGGEVNSYFHAGEFCPHTSWFLNMGTVYFLEVTLDEFDSPDEDEFIEGIQIHTLDSIESLILSQKMYCPLSVFAFERFRLMKKHKHIKFTIL